MEPASFFASLNSETSSTPSPCSPKTGPLNKTLTTRIGGTLFTNKLFPNSPKDFNACLLYSSILLNIAFPAEASGVTYL